ARAVLSGDRGSLARQIERPPSAETPGSPLVPAASPADTWTPPPEPRRLLFGNGVGGFTPDGREYVVTLAERQYTPCPCITVGAGPDFGFPVSEPGWACTWSVNSHENRLTPWANDPVSDPPGEAIYLRDEETGEFWTPTALPVRDAGPYVARHG